MLYLCVYMHINVYDFCGRHATAYYTLIQMRVLVVLLVAACTCCLSTLAYVRQIRANAYICTSHLLKTMLAESTLYTNTHTQVSTCRCSHIQLYACMHACTHACTCTCTCTYIQQTRNWCVHLYIDLPVVFTCLFVYPWIDSRAYLSGGFRT